MMQIRIAGRQIEIGLGLPQRVREKLLAMVSKYFDRNAEASVTFMKARTGFRAVCSVHFSSGALMQAQGTGRSAHRAFDMALDHLETRLRRYMRRLKNHHVRGGHVPAARA
jgi:ribosomal subunit interface protein